MEVYFVLPRELSGRYTGVRYSHLSLTHSWFFIIIFTGGPMSQDGIIAVASSISVFIITSTSSLFWDVCVVATVKSKQMPNAPSAANQPAPVYYEDVLPKDCKQILELQSNVAYAPITKK